MVMGSQWSCDLNLSAFSGETVLVTKWYLFHSPMQWHGIGGIPSLCSVQWVLIGQSWKTHLPTFQKQCWSGPCGDGYFVWAFSVYMFKIPNILIFISFCMLESCQVWAISYSEIECYVQNYLKMSKITLTLWYSLLHGIKASTIFRLRSCLQYTSLCINKYSKSGKIILNTINVWSHMSWPCNLYFWDCSVSVKISRTSVWLMSPQRSLKRLLNPCLHRSAQTWLHARATWGVLELLMPGAHAPGFWWNCFGNSLVIRSSKSSPVESDAHLEERCIGRGAC